MMPTKPSTKPRIHRQPLAAPDWRWRRCVELSGWGRRRAKVEDDIVVQALPAVRRFVRGLDHSLECESLPGLAEAHALQHGPEKRKKHEVRARILARQTDEEIAERCNVTADTVRWFHDMFYDVRDRLSAEGWIWQEVIQHVSGRQIFYHDESKLLNVFAYAHGALHVDRILNYLNRRSRAEDVINGHDGSTPRERLDFLRIHLLILLMTLPYKESTQKQYLRACPIIEEHPDVDDVRGEVPELKLILPNVDDLLAQIVIQPVKSTDKLSAAAGA